MTLIEPSSSPLKAKLKIFSALVILSALSWSSSSSATKLYKWVDGNGNISYQSSPPPESAKILSEKTLKATATVNQGTQKVQPITVYVIEDCASCDDLIARLSRLDISVIQQSLQDRDIQKQVIDATNQLIAPTILIDGSYITDVSQSNIESKLEQAGYKLSNSSNAADLPSNNSGTESQPAIRPVDPNS